MIAAFRALGFEAIREAEHIAMRRTNREGGSDCLTMPSRSNIKASPFVNHLTQAGIRGMIFYAPTKNPDIPSTAETRGEVIVSSVNRRPIHPVAVLS